MFRRLIVFFVFSTSILLMTGCGSLDPSSLPTCIYANSNGDLAYQTVQVMRETEDKEGYIVTYPQSTDPHAEWRVEKRQVHFGSECHVPGANSSIFMQSAAGGFRAAEYK